MSTIEVSPQGESRAARGNIICFGAVFLFAFGFPALDELLRVWGPITVITVRIILTVAFLFPLWFFVDGPAAIRAAPWGKGLGIGAVGFGVGTVLLVISQWLSDAVTAALLVTTLPIFAVALEVAFDGRRLRWRFVAGLLLVLLGGYLATGASIWSAQYGLGAALGALASAMFAWGSRATVQALPGMSNLGQTTLTFTGTMLFCMSCFAVFALFGWEGVEGGMLTPREISMLLIYAWGAMAVSQLLWIAGVDRLGVALASFHLNAVPFYVMLILFAMGAAWDWNKALGAAILGIGVILAQSCPRKQGIHPVTATQASDARALG